VLDVQGGAGHDTAQGARSKGLAAEVESPDHAFESRRATASRPGRTGSSFVLPVVP
jgi:hypothetical protein